MLQPLTRRHLFAIAERGMLRVAMLAIGFVMMVVGLGLGVTMIMLPAGLVIGLAGLAISVWGAVGDMPIGG